MNRIPPSKRIRSQIEALMNGAFEDQEDLLSQLVRLGVQQLIQEALEQEWTVLASPRLRITAWSKYRSLEQSFR